MGSTSLTTCVTQTLSQSSSFLLQGKLVHLPLCARQNIWSFEPDSSVHFLRLFSVCLFVFTSLLFSLHFTSLQSSLHFSSVFTSAALQLHIRSQPNRIEHLRLLASSIWCWKSSSNSDSPPAVGVGGDITATVGQQGPADEQPRFLEFTKGTSYQGT